MTLPEIIIIVNTIFPVLACVQLIRTLLISKALEERLSSVQEDLTKVGLLYLLSTDKILVQRLSRLIIWLLVTANILLTYWGLERITNDFLQYATKGIAVTAFIFHLVMFLVAHFTFMIYNRSDLSFLRKIKI